MAASLNASLEGCRCGIYPCGEESVGVGAAFRAPWCCMPCDDLFRLVFPVACGEHRDNILLDRALQDEMLYYDIDTFGGGDVLFGFGYGYSRSLMNTISYVISTSVSSASPARVLFVDSESSDEIVISVFASVDVGRAVNRRDSFSTILNNGIDDTIRNLEYACDILFNTIPSVQTRMSSCIFSLRTPLNIPPPVTSFFRRGSILEEHPAPFVRSEMRKYLDEKKSEGISW